MALTIGTEKRTVSPPLRIQGGEEERAAVKKLSPFC